MKEHAFPAFGPHAIAPDAATAASRQFLLALLLTIKNASLYGAEHPIVERASRALPELLDGAFSNRDWVVLQVAGEGLQLDGRPLGPENPIWSQAADTLSALGIAVLRLGRGLDGEETAALVGAVSRARAARLDPTEARRLLEQTPLEHVRIEYLRDLLRFRVRAEVARPPDADRPQRAPIRPDDAEPDAEHQAFLAEIRRLVPTLPDSLRRQLLAVGRGEHADGGGAGAPTRLGSVPVRESLLGALEQLTRQGETIPESVYRTLRFLFDLGAPPPATVAEPTALSADSARDLLDGLLRDDQRRSYVSGEYEAKMRALREFVAAHLGRETIPDASEPLSRDEAEEHFLFVANDLLPQFADDADVLRGLAAGARDVLTFFADAARDSRWEDALALVKRVERAAPARLPLDRLYDRGLLERLISIAAGAAETRRRAARMLARIGAGAAPPLVEAVGGAEEPERRRRLTACLIEMEDDPGAVIDDRLRQPGSEQVVLDLLAVLRERRDDRAGVLADALWPTAPPALRGEMLHCLLCTHHPRRRERLRAMLYSKHPREVLVAGRLASLYPDGGALGDLVERIRADGPWRQGSRLQIGLLLSLAQCRRDDARPHLQGFARGLQPRLPWRRRRLLGVLEFWLGGRRLRV